MEKIEIGNKLISEYMALKNPDGSFYQTKDDLKGTLLFNTPRLSINYMLPPEHKNFDKYYGKWENDWNWLMPVYTKINNYIIERSMIDFKFGHETNQLHLNMWIAFEDYSETPLALWSAIVEYIKWENSQSRPYII